MDYNISYRKKDGATQCIISYKDNDGKWRQKSKQGFKRQKDAKPWIKDTVEKLEETIKTPNEFRGITFGEFKEIFMEDKKRELSRNTVELYNTSFKRFTDLDSYPLCEIKYIHISPCINKMLDSGMKNGSIKTYLTKIKAVFNHAINNYEIIADNPAKNKQYKLPSEIKKNKIKALNKSELEDLLSKLKGKDYYISLIASKCGLRIGEIVGLTTQSFDFDNGDIHITKQWKLLDSGKYGFGTVKSTNSYRTVPIPIEYIFEIKEYVYKCVVGIDGRIFLDNDTSTSSSRLSQKYKRLGFDISAHDLRHTYATTLLANGIDYKTVAELMGDRIETIIKTYSHFNNDMMISAKEKINNIL